MSVVTIPKQMAQEGDLVVLPRADYEALIASQKYNDRAVIEPLTTSDSRDPDFELVLTDEAHARLRTATKSSRKKVSFSAVLKKYSAR